LEELTPKQYLALTRLASGSTNKEAAEAAGVALRTIEGWKTKPEFQKLLKTAVNMMLDAALAELVSGSQLAAKQLVQIISDPDTPSRTKVTAISVLFDTAVKVKQWNLEDRLARVEITLDGFEPSQNSSN
jgi:hypothetical protein